MSQWHKFSILHSYSEGTDPAESPLAEFSKTSPKSLERKAVFGSVYGIPSGTNRTVNMPSLKVLDTSTILMKNLGDTDLEVRVSHIDTPTTYSRFLLAAGGGLLALCGLATLVVYETATADNRFQVYWLE